MYCTDGSLLPQTQIAKFCPSFSRVLFATKKKIHPLPNVQRFLKDAKLTRWISKQSVV